MNVIMLRSFAVVIFGVLSAGAVAQDVDESALDALNKRSAPNSVIREVPGSAELRASMRRIALSPTDADALADAGNAALTLGDANAALNFFTRASIIRPRDGRIISGLAVATVRTENPFEALRLFDNAVKLGVSERSIAADRALAFDLLGNFARAQQDYSLARSASSSPDLVVRQAISLSLADRKSEADGMLVPLLDRNNAAAWRARALMLAARGDYRESVKVAQGFMDARSAQKMERYLRLMPDLTPAQQAAAIHLGHFPANNIGRDSENVRRVAANIPNAQPIGSASRLIPSGQPLGQKQVNAKPVTETKKARRERERQEKQAKADMPVKTAATDDGLSTSNARLRVDEARVATMSVARAGALPPPETVRPLVGIALPVSEAAQRRNIPKVAVVTPIIQKIPVSAMTRPTVETNVAVVANPALQGRTESRLPVATVVPNPMRSIAVVAPTPAAQAIPVSIPAAASKVSPAFDLAAIVNAITIPDSEQKPSAVAVDLKKLKSVTPKVAVVEPLKGAKIDAKMNAKAAPTNPARFWVQIATGEASGLAFDYRRSAKKYPAVFKGQSGWTSAWGKTDRLLIGPFADLKASKKWEAEYKKAGGEGFAWKSENGIVVTALKGK